MYKVSQIINLNLRSTPCFKTPVDDHKQKKANLQIAKFCQIAATCAPPRYAGVRF
jgi:hypothetical protein